MQEKQNTNPGQIRDFLETINTLKVVKRQGWLDKGMLSAECESVADHIFRTSLVAMLLADLDDSINKEKVLTMALVHDIGESLIGDISKESPLSREEKYVLEENAVKNIFSKIENGKKYTDIWYEFEKGETEEAKIVHSADALDMMLQCKQYEDTKKKNFSTFWEYAKKVQFIGAANSVYKSLVSERISHEDLTKTENYIKNSERKIYSIISPFIQGSVLKIGSGLGFLTSYIEKSSEDIIVLEIEGSSPSRFSQTQPTIYDGIYIPYEDNYFDTSIVSLVLHHTPDPEKLLREIVRVSKRVIITEETYESIFGKLDLVYRDILINRKAKQPSKIFWNSYFKSGGIENILKSLTRVFTKKWKHRKYFKQIFVYDKK